MGSGLKAGASDDPGLWAGPQSGLWRLRGARGRVVLPTEGQVDTTENPFPPGQALLQGLTHVLSLKHHTQRNTINPIL